jgi:hypothetical protein
MFTVLRCRSEGNVIGHIRITSEQRDKLNVYNTYTVVQYNLTEKESRILLSELNKRYF